jgi:hypothetical protein
MPFLLSLFFLNPPLTIFFLVDSTGIIRNRVSRRGTPIGSSETRRYSTCRTRSLRASGFTSTVQLLSVPGYMALPPLYLYVCPLFRFEDLLEPGRARGEC